MDTLNNPLNKENTAFDAKNTEVHSSDLGYQIPNDYFKTSKKDILNQIESSDSVRVLWLKNKKVMLSMVATVALILSLAVFKKKEDVTEVEKYKNNNMALLEENNDLINSLFIDDLDTDDMVDVYLKNKVLEDL